MSAFHSTIDTSETALNVQLEGLRQMSPQQRIQRMCAMTAHVRDLAMKAIRRRHPDLSDDEVRLRFIELTYGYDLANAIRKAQGANV